jgi:hypothetical protein
MTYPLRPHHSDWTGTINDRRGQALGVSGGGNSLDNTLGVCRMVPTEWVLRDIRVHAVEDLTDKHI